MYNITKGQLITVWVFSAFGWIAASNSYSDFAAFWMLFIPFMLIFYTIGWRNKRKGN